MATTTDEVIVKVIPMSQCAACLSEEKTCWKGDCPCHDLTFCEECWKQWISTSTLRFENQQHAGEVQLVLICSKCHNTLFKCEAYSEDVQKPYSTASMCLIVFFLFLGLCGIIASNIIVTTQKKKVSSGILVFILWFDFISILITVRICCNIQVCAWRDLKTNTNSGMSIIDQVDVISESGHKFTYDNEEHLTVLNN